MSVGAQVAADAPAGERVEYVERVVRALRISGRRLVKTRTGWSVIIGEDRRCRPRLLLDEAEVERLTGDGKLIAADEETYVLADVRIEPPPVVEPWAFILSGKRKAARAAGLGFTALAVRARKGLGPPTMRHVQAGLRLITDVERSDTSRGLTMDWASGPVDRQRRSGGAGGLQGMAQQAARRVRRVRALTGADTWGLAWALCVEATSLRVLRVRFGLGHREVGRAVAAALEALALAYEG